MVNKPKDRGRRSLYLQMASTIIALLVLLSVFTESKSTERTLTSGAGMIACLIFLAVIGVKLFKSRKRQHWNDRKP